MLNEDRKAAGNNGVSQISTVFTLGGDTDFIRRRRAFQKPYTADGEDHKRIIVSVKAPETSGAWTVVKQGSIRNLKDRAGIKFELNAINADDVTSAVLHVGLGSVGDTVYIPLDTVSGVKVCAILHADQCAEGEAARADDAASRYTYERYIENPAYRRVYRHTTSEYYTSAEGTTLRDDEAKADAAAEIQRNALQHLKLSSTFVLPWIDYSFTLGQHVRGIGEPESSDVAGRDMSFQVNRSQDAPIYPVIVGIRMDFEHQQTAIMLSDMREAFV